MNLPTRQLFTGLLLAFALATAACHDVGDVKVISLAFDGVESFRPATLKKILATRSSGWLPWSRKHYFDRAAFEADLKRITAFYQDRGFPDARVTGVTVDFNEAKNGVRLRIGIEEGAPVIVEDVRFEGFDVLGAEGTAVLNALPLKAGARRDRDVVRSTRDQAARLFRDHGYPLAAIDAGERPGNAAGSVIVTYRADPGAAMTFGPVTVHGLEQLEEKVIQRELAFAPGDVFDERRVTQSQRRLGGLEFLELAVVTPRLDEAGAGAVPMAVTVAEGKPRRLRLGVGYGSEELARATISWQHLNFGGGAKQATVDGKWSAIDRGVDLALIDPHAWRTGFSTRVSVSGWRTEQLTYDSESYGGTAGLIWRTDRVSTRRKTARYRAELTYAFNRLRYGIKPEFLEDQSRRDERIALGLDPDTGRASGRLATAQVDLERQAVDNPADPARGSVLSAHTEFAAPAFGGTYRYTEVGGEVRGFIPLGPLVLAGRFHAGVIGPADSQQVPFSKRYFLGGSNALRGWSRFEVSPLDADGRPIGGHAVVDFSGEVRLPVPGFPKIGLVPFVDGGNVWRDRQGIDFGDLRWAAGLGVRYLTPIGALRVDFAAQLNPIPGLVVNGEPSTRRWRVHFNLGHSF